MEAPRGQGSVRGRPPAHPLEFDERGLPLAQQPLTAAERLRAERLTREPTRTGALGAAGIQLRGW
jgi:hypothetical protein